MKSGYLYKCNSFGDPKFKKGASLGPNSPTSFWSTQGGSTRIRKGCLAAGRIMPLTAIALCLGFTGLDGTGDAPTEELGQGAPIVTATEYGDIGPVADLLSDILDIIDAMLKALEGAEDETESAWSSEGGSGQIATATLAVYLNSAEADIDQILDGNQYPSLTPVDAGDIDPTVFPLTLSEHASTCVEAAQQAYDELLFPVVNHEFVGTKLKTIKALLPEYRALAGIE